MLENAKTAERPAATSGRAIPNKVPAITSVDNVLRDDQRKALYDFLRGPGWKFGWKSHPNASEYSFWHNGRKFYAPHVRIGSGTAQRRRPR